MPFEPERGREPARGIDGEHQHLAAEPNRSTERGRGRDRRLADATRSAEHHDFLRREQLLERRRIVVVTPPRLHDAVSQAELLAERVGDHPRDAQTVGAHEEIRHVQQRQIDRFARVLRGGPRACAAARPRAAPHRAPRSRRCRPRSASSSRGSGARKASNVSSSACVNSSGSTRLTITVPSGTFDLGAQSLHELDRFRDRHLFRRRHDVDRRDLGIGEQIRNPLRLVAQRPDVDQLTDRIGRAELRDDVARSRQRRR